MSFCLKIYIPDLLIVIELSKINLLKKFNFVFETDHLKLKTGVHYSRLNGIKSVPAVAFIIIAVEIFS